MDTAEDAAPGERPPNAEGASSPLTLPKLIKPVAAVDRLEAYYGGSTKELLADKLRDGLIRAYALRSWVAKGRSLEQAWASRPRMGVVRKQQIPREAFLRNPNWYEDIRGWDWVTGDFFCTEKSPRPVTTRMMFKNVRFAREDVEALITKAEQAVRKGKGGRHPDREAWENVWMEILALALDGNLFQAKTNVTTSIIVELQRRQKREGGEVRQLGPGMIGELVNRIFERFAPTGRSPARREED